MIRLLLAVALSAGCQQEKGDGTVAGQADEKGSHECTVTIAAEVAPAPPVTGSGTAKDESIATEAAWKDACDKLPPPEQPACRDPARYQAATGIARAEEVTVTVTLTPAPPPQVSGSAASNESREAACHAALLDACEKAGGQGDCVTAGTHRRVEEAGAR